VTYMKQSKVSEFKAKLSHFLRLVRRGEEIIVVDHNLPVARVSQISDVEDVEISEPSLTIQEVLAGLPKLPPSDTPTDSLGILREERQLR